MKNTVTLHPATAKALTALAVTAPKAPLKGRGHRRVTFTPALRGLAAAVWSTIPRNHRDEVAIDRSGTVERIISPEAARKAAKALTSLGMSRPTRASLSVRRRTPSWYVTPVGNKTVARRFATAAAAHEWAQSRGLAYSISKF